MLVSLRVVAHKTTHVHGFYLPRAYGIPKYLKDILIPSLDQPIDHLTIIVPPRKTLGKILSSTWVIR
jgi:hypothetical protein